MNLVGKYVRDPSVIFLLDGPPETAPSHRWVCCTSPNEGWMDSHRKDCIHWCLYMPLWTLDELRRAVRAVGATSLLGEVVGVANSQVSPRLKSYLATETAEVNAEDVVEARYRIFGVVARVCLSGDIDFVADEFAHMVHAIQNVELEEVPRILHMEGDTADGIHSVFYYHPLTYPTEFIGQVASKHVERLLVHEITIRHYDSDELGKILYRISNATGLCGWIIEARVHSIMMAGCQSRGQLLERGQPPSAIWQLSVVKSGVSDGLFFESDFTLESLDIGRRGPYYIASLKNHAAVDSFYLVPPPHVVLSVSS